MTASRFDHVVEAISDGERIDWPSVRRRLADGGAGDYSTHLETISKIGRLTQDSDGPHQQDLREPAWVRVMIAFTFVQIVTGIVGAIGYRLHSLVDLLRLLLLVSFAGVGILLRQGRNNARGRDLGAAFLLRAFAFGRNPTALLLAAWLPASPAIDVLRSGFAVDAWMPFFFWRFARRFPAISRFTLIDRIAVRFTTIAGVIGTMLFAINLIAVLFRQTGGIWTLATTYPGQQRFFATTLALILPALLIILIRAQSAAPDERARARAFAVAMFIGGTLYSLQIISEGLVPAYLDRLHTDEVFQTRISLIVLPLLLTMPFATGYAVLVHRMFDIRFAIRQGVRYLLAKWSLAALTLAPFGLLASNVYARRNDSVAVVFSDRRGLVLLALVALGGALFAGRAVLVRRLDRWFDRAGADRTNVLARIGDQLRLARTRSELAVSVAKAAGGALNAPAVVYFFDQRRHAFVPCAHDGPSLPADSALASVLMEEPTLTVLRTDLEHSIARFLPRTEKAWLGDTNVSVLAPIRSTGVDRPAGLIAFGPRRDAIGYSKDDEQFVAAMASAAGIAFENLRLKSEAAGDEPDGEFGTLCLRCHRVSDVDESRPLCPCGGQLQTAAVPRRINQKFLVEALLGSGGMGVAYLASDIALGRYVAIKTLPAVSADAMARLSREARTMAALSHPNLATILAQELWRGTPILVCEYLLRGTLQQRLTRGPLALDEALSLALTLLDALEYMHGQGVLHRDIKPSNIGFASDWTPKLLDFGLAGLMELAQPESIGQAKRAPLLGTTLAGTLAYMPPQALEGAAPSAAFDLWALTVVLYESIVGAHPFAAGADTAENICRGRFVAPIGLEIPRNVSVFLRDALSPNTSRHFASSDMMREALNTLRISIAHP